MSDFYEWISVGAAALILVPCVISDVRRQKISAYYLMAALSGCFLFVLWRIYSAQETPSDLFLSVMPGVFLLLTAGIAPGRIGAGDGVVFLVIGLMVGCRNAFVILFLALLFTAGYGGYLLVRRKADRGQTVAWMPFVLLGYLAWFAWMIYAGVFQL